MHPWKMDLNEEILSSDDELDFSIFEENLNIYLGNK